MKKRNRAVCVAAETMERRLLLSGLNILTHHEDYNNDGANADETVLTPANVNATDFGKQFTAPLDGGDVIASPLYMQNVDITTGSSPGIHSVVFVATEADGLFALDANTGATLWEDNFTNITNPQVLTPTTGVTTVQQSDIANNPDVGTQLGILATPAIDANTGIIYLNANTKEIRADGKHFVQRLWAVSVSNGAPVTAPALIGDTIAPDGLSTTGPYTYVAGPIINGTGNNNPAGHPTPVYPDTDGWTAAPGGASGYVVAFNAIEQMERTAVSLINGSVYLGFASHGDDGPYYGWVLGYNASTLALDAAFCTTPTFEPSSIVGSSQPFWNLGGIWMSGSNIATDGTNLYVVTGNGAFNGDASNFDANGFPIDHDYGDSVLKLTPDSSTQANQNGNGWGLKVTDYFTPSNQLELNDDDLDLGSGGATLLPNNILDAAGNPMLMVGGKESRVYLLDRNNLGKYNYNYPSGSTDNPALFDHVIAEYANNGLNNGGKQIYSSAAYYNGDLYIGVNSSSALEFNIADMVAGNPAPIAETSLSWGYPGETFVISSDGNTDGIAWAENPGGSDLLAYNASSFTTPIYDSNTNTADSLGGTIHFHVPTEAQGMVYAGSRGGGLGGYGLDLSYLDSNSTYFGAPTGLASTMVSPTDAHLSWTSHSTLATEFRVDRSTNGTTWTTIAYVQGALSTFDDTTLTPNTRYQYRVVAISGANTTAFSNTSVYNPQLVLSGQNLYLKLDGNGTSLDVWDNSNATGGVVQSIMLSQIPSVVVTATGSSDSLTINFSAGDPLPSGGLSFTGSGSPSLLNIIGNSGADTVTVGGSALTVSGTFGSVPITYADATAINFIGGAGSNTMNQTAPSTAAVSFQDFNANDTINVSAGSMTIPMPTTGAPAPVAQLGRLLVGAGAQVALSAPTGPAESAVLEVGTLTLAGNAGNWTGRLDLAGNDLVLQSGILATVDSQIGQAFATAWVGGGLTSSAVAADSTHLTALGAIINNDGSGNPLYGSDAPLGLFDGLSPAVTSILVKDTLMGDANLDGSVNASDYSRIDSAFLSDQTNPDAATGWFNGDFNYDGVINGSDYTLIDNAFNLQGSYLPERLAFATAAPTIVAGATSGNIMLQLRSPLGTPVSAPAGGITVNLTSTSSGGEFFNGSSNAVTNIVIPAGASSVNIQYSDTLAGTPVITATAAGEFPASLTVTVTPVSVAAQLAFSTPAFTQAVASTSGTMTVTLEDPSGNAFNAGAGGLVVNLTSNSTGATFLNSSGGAITSVTIPAGSTSASFQYSDTLPGAPTVTVSASGVNPALQQETLTDTLTTIVFTTPAHTMIVGTSPATVTIQLEDQAGNPIAAGATGVTINLSTTSSGGTFYNSGNGVVTSVTVPSGSTSVTVAYRDTVVGTPTLRASSSGLATISQQQTVSAMPSGVAAFYSFGTTAGLLTDTSGSNNTLKVGGGTVAFTTTALPAGFTGAAAFSNSGYLTTSSGSFPVNVPTGNSSYTIAAWIDINNANKNGIVGWGNWGTTDQVNAFRTTQGDAAPNGAGLDNYWWSDDYIQATPTTLVNTWAYVAVTYNGSVRSIYFNGVLLGTYTSPNQDNSQAINFRIGSTNNGEYFNGDMSDLLIANTAFSTAQIDELYNGT